MSKPTGHVIYDTAMARFRCKYCGDQSDEMEAEVSTSRLQAYAKSYELWHGQCDTPEPVDNQPDLPNTTPKAMFDSAYPMAQTISGLRVALERVMAPDHWLALESAGWVPVGNAEFADCAHWARVELAHIESSDKKRAGHIELGKGLTIPKQFAMPECIAKFKPKPAKKGRGTSAPEPTE